MASELDAANTAQADELARWLVQQAQELRERSHALADTRLGTLMCDLADFTQVHASSYQAIRRELAREAASGMYEGGLRWREGEVFSSRCMLESLAAQVFRHPGLEQERVRPDEMSLYAVT